MNLMIEEGRAALRAGDASRARDAFERALEDRLRPGQRGGTSPAEFSAQKMLS